MHTGPTPDPQPPRPSPTRVVITGDAKGLQNAITVKVEERPVSRFLDGLELVLGVAVGVGAVACVAQLVDVVVRWIA